MKNTPIATYVLMGLNLLAYAALAFHQQNPMLDAPADVLATLHTGANFNPFTLGGEPWRLITSMFLHFGVIHLLMNMYALYVLGNDLEPAIGSVRFTLVYFICGIGAGLASLLFNLYANSAGASGALFGLFGYRLGAELIGSYHDRQRLSTVIINFIIFVVVNTFISLSFSVDLAAHVGGCVVGLALAVLHFRFKVLYDSRMLAVVLLVFPLTLFALPKDEVRYYQLFQRVLGNENRTSNLFRDVRSDEALADSLHGVLATWKNIQQNLHALPAVPAELAYDTAVLKQYIAVREDETAYRINLIERESYVYMDSLEVVKERFNNIPPLQHILNFTLSDAVEPPDTTARKGPALEMKKVFFDAAWKETDDPNTSEYYRIGTVDSAGRWQGGVRDYYRDGTIQMKGVYDKGMKSGIFLYYSNRGTYTSAGRYVKEESVGRWEVYHWNGVLESEVFYNGEAYVRSLWDSLGRQQVQNGKGKVVHWYADGQVSEEGTYENGKREGDWYGYHPNGKLYYRELYRNNRLVRGVSEDREGKRYVYDQTSFYAFPVKGMAEFNKYLFLQTRKPDFRGGTVKLIFNVGLDGAMWDFVVMEGISPAHDAEAIRLVKEGPAWRPGLLHGHQKQPSQGYVEVTF
ncbi:rhomboid family intramembrane serine protease [Chryseolinea lacunae]|uniref:Rhomboid family intramembrane serine protease n=1 Tax=Chryseolinea lacunae TaxID=2801331 RepID=A0ABS1KTL6_9BACT|nr:rhomboid family intramembrane serine protease [Chryseolinea lacunae]MBL0742781.1 rhomboid family intramembrane serine protease [Chryseolinea lacunae]